MRCQIVLQCSTSAGSRRASYRVITRLYVAGHSERTDITNTRTDMSPLPLKGSRIDRQFLSHKISTKIPCAIVNDKNLDYRYQIQGYG